MPEDEKPYEEFYKTHYPKVHRLCRLLHDNSLLTLDEGEGADEERTHVESCENCAERYRRMRDDLDLIRYTLQQEPAPERFSSSRMPLSYRWIPVAAALLLAIALVWGESRVWRTDSSLPSDHAFNIDLSQFPNEVSDAVLTGTSVGTAGTTSSDSDLTFLQVAPGDSCFDECQEADSSSADEILSFSPEEKFDQSVRQRARKKAKSEQQVY